MAVVEVKRSGRWTPRSGRDDQEVVHPVFSRTRSQFIVSSCRGKGGHSDYRQMSQEYDHRRTVVDICHVPLFVTQGHGTRGGMCRSKDKARRAMARGRAA